MHSRTRADDRSQPPAAWSAFASGVHRCVVNASVLLVVLLACTLDGAQAALSAASSTHVRAALIIGNARYARVGVLKNPENDAHDMCESLKAIGYQATCLVDIDTRVRMRAVIEDFVEGLPENAVTVVYYAGHAVQVNGENYLVPTGARLTDQVALVRDAVSLSFLMRELKRTQGYLTVVILDACRNNPLAAEGETLPQGLAQITDIPDGTEVLYATAVNEPALDGQGRNGTLTKHLLAHIREPGTIDDLFKQVSLGVQSETQQLGHTQKPALYTNFTGQYCFVRCTDLELLQRQRQEAQQRIVDLQARVDAGDQQALSELTIAKSENERLKNAIQKKDEDAKKAEQVARERQKQSFVPPSF